MLRPFDRLDPALQAFVAAMPKAELHIHLEGAIQPETVLALAQRHAMLDRLPSAELDALRAWFKFTDFPHFIQVYMTIQDLLRTPADFALIVEACGADMAAQGIRYRELTVTPFTHVDIQRKNLTMDQIQAGLDEGRARARERYGVEMRWVYDVPRNAGFPRGYASHNGEGYNPWPAQRTLEYAIAGLEHGVIGYGLGGYEVGAPPAPFAHAFAEAKAAGLLSLPHAGETVGAASVWGAVNELGAHRIGHGVRAMEDPALLTLLKDRAIPLEVSPTSNICLHVYRRLAEHPLPHLDRMGIVVTVNSDDPPLFNTRLLDEYALLALEFGYDAAGIARLARNAFVAAGAEPPVKDALLAEFDAWSTAQGVEVSPAQP